MKHVKLRFVYRETEEGLFEPVDIAHEHIDAAFEASCDVLENYEAFLLITRLNESINNFAVFTFEADFSEILQALRGTFNAIFIF